MQDEHSRPESDREYVSPTDITVPDMEPVQVPPTALPPLMPFAPLPVQEPVWPPVEPMYTRRETASPTKIALIAIMAIALVGGSLGFLLFVTAAQYRTTLSTDSTAFAHSTSLAQQTSQAYAQATANVFATANAKIYASATAQIGATATLIAQQNNVTATATAYGNILTQITGGSAALNDPLSDNSGDNNWDVTNNTVNSACFFNGTDYQLDENQQDFFQPCLAETTDFSNFAYQVSMTINQGAQAGIVFRASPAKDSFYFFHVGVDGTYALDLYKSNSKATTLASGFSSAITTGEAQTNILAVIAYKGTIYLYANQTYIALVTDKTLSSGKIGVAALDTDVPTEAEFSAAEVWNLSTLPSPSSTSLPGASPSASPRASPSATASPRPSPSVSPSSTP
jgi:hypothetical protein